MSDIAQEPASGLVRHIAEATSTVLSQIVGTALQVETVSLDAATEAATLIRLDISGALEGTCEIALSAPMTVQFAALLTGETPDPAAEINSDTREAAAELIQQICGNAADRLRHSFGPLELKSHLAQRDPETGTRQLFLITRENDVLEFELHILHLVLHLVPEPKPIATAETAGYPSTQAAVQDTTRFAAASDPMPPFSQLSNRNLDLLLNIELGVTLRFGTRQMLLKDIIELCSGSVVALDRRVQEPVDLLIDGHLIAQGEVVIVEGNYGLRILQVAIQGEKIACLPLPQLRS